MADSSSIVNLIDCFFFFSSNFCLKAPQSGGHCLSNTPLPTSNAFLIAAKSSWINMKFHVNNPCKLPLCHSEKKHQFLVFNMYNHPVPTSCHFVTTKSGGIYSSSYKCPLEPIWLYPNSLVGPCFCLLYIVQNHTLLSATVYTARTPGRSESRPALFLFYWQ